MDPATTLAPLDAALEGLGQGRAEESLSAVVSPPFSDSNDPIN